MANSSIKQSSEKTVSFKGKLRIQIEKQAAEAGLTFEEFVKAQMSLKLNN